MKNGFKRQKTENAGVDDKLCLYVKIKCYVKLNICYFYQQQINNIEGKLYVGFSQETTNHNQISVS